MTIKDIQSHVSDAVSRLPDQFINSSNLINLVSIGAGRTQGINDEIIKILDGMSISTAIGKQLDNLATILNLTRIIGESDDDFRARIFSETSILAKSGEPSHVVDVYLLLTEASSVFMSENFPACVQLTAHTDSDAQDQAVDSATISSMNNVKGGGISIILVISPETEYFFFDSVANVDASGNGTQDSSGGFGSISDVQGGKLSRVLK